MVVRVRSSPFRTLTNGNPELSTLTSDIPLGYLNSHKRNPELSTLTSDIFFPGTNSHIRKSELRTLTFDIPSGASTLVAPLGRGASAAGILVNLACTTITNSISYLRTHPSRCYFIQLIDYHCPSMRRCTACELASIATCSSSGASRTLSSSSSMRRSVYVTTRKPCPTPTLGQPRDPRASVGQMLP